MYIGSSNSSVCTSKSFPINKMPKVSPGGSQRASRTGRTGFVELRTDQISRQTVVADEQLFPESNIHRNYIHRSAFLFKQEQVERAKLVKL
jgi:hypothetical protein